MKNFLSKIYRLNNLTLFFCFLLISKTAHSEISVEFFNQHKHTSEMKLYVNGLGTAYSWMNVYSSQNKKTPIYCPPKELAITSENYFRLLEDSINQKKNNMGFIEPMLLDQLVKVFPCNKWLNCLAGLHCTKYDYSQWKVSMQNTKQSQNLGNSLHIRVSPAIEARLQYAARANGQKLSSYARLLLVRSLHEVDNHSLPVWMR